MFILKDQNLMAKVGGERLELIRGIHFRLGNFSVAEGPRDCCAYVFAKLFCAFLSILDPNWPRALCSVEPTESFAVVNSFLPLDVLNLVVVLSRVKAGD